MAKGQNITCPVCRSILTPVGKADINAPSISRPECPICGYPEYIPSVQNPGFVNIPYRWETLEVVKANPKPTVLYEDVKAFNPVFAKNTDPASVTKENQENRESIYKDFSVPEALGESVKAVSKGIGQTVGNVIGGVAEGTTSGLFKGLGTTSLPILIILAVVAYIYFKE